MLVEYEEGSLEGRGKDELIPRRGDPFSRARDSKGPTSQDDQSDIYPTGEERSEDPGAMSMKNESSPRTRPREDGGMRAVGPPLPEDLFSEAVPPPRTEPELPPPSTFDSEPRYSTLGETSLGSNEQSLPPFLRTRDEQHNSASENLLVSDIRINWLRERAAQLELRIGREIDNQHLRKLLQDQLNLTRDQNICNRKQFDEAERVLNEVENRINLAERVRAWSASVRMRLILLELAFAMFIIIGLVFLPDALLSTAPSILPAQASGMVSSLVLLVNSMLWGGLGGVFSALVGLQTHKILEEGVDRNWAVWYIATPFMGVVLGAFLFLIVRATLLLIFPSTGGQITSDWVVYLVSWLAGFQQNFAYEIVERIMTAFDRKRT